ncbi:hypothetical protein F4810DRAFT_655503 [Camillea tinctor]|nr:hypothetical protein F4810DRAFT_655503 [Camillea tinctor]
MIRRVKDSNVTAYTYALHTLHHFLPSFVLGSFSFPPLFLVLFSRRWVGEWHTLIHTHLYIHILHYSTYITTLRTFSLLLCREKKWAQSPDVLFVNAHPLREKYSRLFEGNRNVSSFSLGQP